MVTGQFLTDDPWALELGPHQATATTVRTKGTDVSWRRGLSIARANRWASQSKQWFSFSVRLTIRGNGI